MMVTEHAIGSHELVVWATDEGSGLHAAIAVHRAYPAIALGQVTFRPAGEDSSEAVLEALERSRRLTDAARTLEVPVAGASVVVSGAPGRPGHRRAMDAIGRIMTRLDRQIWLIPGPGSTPEDLSIVGRQWALVAGAQPADHHLPPAARGAVASARTALRRQTDGGFAGSSVLVLGAGRLGEVVDRMLAAQDARVMIADRDDVARAASLADEVDGVLVQWTDALTTSCDVMMPCTANLALSVEAVEMLRCSVLVGPADGQLEDEAISSTIAARGIVWVPEVLAGAGALMAAAREMGVAHVRQDVDSDSAYISRVTAEILDAAESDGIEPRVVLEQRGLQSPGSPDGGPGASAQAA